MPPIFITSAHNIRGRCWWYDSRGWTFPPIFHYILLLFNRWLQRGSLTKWCLAQKCARSKGVSLNSSMKKKNTPLTLTDVCWTFLETKQWIRGQSGGGWHISIHSTIWIGRLQPGHFLQSWLLASMCWKSGDAGISQSLCQARLTNAHTSTERTFYAGLSGPIEPIYGWRWPFPGLRH